MKYLDADWPVFEMPDDADAYDLIYEMSEYNTDRAGREYDMVGQFLADDDFYQGLNMVTVIRRRSDGKQFGYFWWNDISKHGESFVEPNGDEYGLEGYCEADGDWNTFVSFYVWEPVEEYSIKAYRSSNED